MDRTTATALIAAVITGCIAGVAFAVAGVPTSGAVVLGVVVVLLLAIVQLALSYAAKD